MASICYSLVMCGLPAEVASLAAAFGLQCTLLSTCGSRAPLPCGLWGPSRSGIEPLSPALAGKSLTTGPPGKPSKYLLCLYLPCAIAVPGEGNGNSLQYFCLENPMDRGAWWAAVHGVAEWDMTEATWHAAMECQECREHLKKKKRNYYCCFVRTLIH